MSLPPPKSRSVRRVARATGLKIDRETTESVRHLGDRMIRIDSSTAKETPAPDTNPPVDLDAALAELGTQIRPKTIPKTKSPQDWLRFHASDLIDRLTEWSDDLHVREANLHAQQAMWDRQARRLRLQFQETQCELDEIEARLKRSNEHVADREQQLRVTARRLALASM